MQANQTRVQVKSGVALSVRSVTFSYGALQVLFGVDLDVGAGEIVALLGTNGAGKSTLLRLAAGLSKPSDGSISLDGEAVTGVGALGMVRRGVALVVGGKGVFPELSVGDNLEVGCYTIRNTANRRRRIETSIELFPLLRGRLSQTAGSLSGGEQQQLAIAKALLLEPRMLLIDELSLGLAPLVVAQLLDVVRAVSAAGTSVVLVEQSLNVAADLAARSYFLEKGEVRFHGQTRELLDRSDIARAVFLGGER